MWERLSRLFRPTVRLRLTLFYGCLFFVVAAAMLVLLYALLSRELRPPQDGRRDGPLVGRGAAIIDGRLDEADVERRIFEVR